MKKIFAILFAALMLLGFSTAFAATPNSFIDGNVRQIDKKTYDAIPAGEFSSNNGSVKVEGLGVFFSDNVTLNSWYLDVADYVKGSIDIAYKISSRYFIVEFDIYGPGIYRVGDSKGSNEINMVKIGVFNEVENIPPETPVITKTPSDDVILVGTPITITAEAIDPDGDELEYIWEGRIDETAEYPLGWHVVKVTARDAFGGESSAQIEFYIRDNSPPDTPVITRSPSDDVIVFGTPVTITAEATDPDGDELEYIWEGRIAETAEYPLGWNVVKVTARDPFGAESSAQIEFFVKVPTYTVTWNPSGGTVSETNRMVDSGDAVGTLPTASWPGYQFAGWWTGPTTGTEITADTIISGNTTFFARWNVNGQPIPVGGYNGGGNGGTRNADTASGGGATHISFRYGLLAELNSYKSDVIIVAGGGGGSGCYNTIGGEGGGEAGTVGNDTLYLPKGQGGTQTGGGQGGTNSMSGSFGQGGHTGVSQLWPGGGGGGGWYGGGAGSNLSGGGSSGGGGSGYIGGVASGSMITGIRAGDGMARITGPDGTVWTFEYRGAIVSFVVPVTGQYTLETWGAAGGKSGHGARGGYGGYAKGTIQLTTGQTIYIVVGGQGINEAQQ